jgi:hypothetical protein
MLRILVSLFLLFHATPSFAGGFKSFTEENERIKAKAICNDVGVSPHFGASGKLFGCITGKAMTVKLFVNETKDKNRVEHIKLMWNDWFIDSGHGLHADKSEAEQLVKVVADLYAPTQKARLMKVFFASNNEIWIGGLFKFAFTISRGTKIDERLLTITEQSLKQEPSEKSQSSVVPKTAILWIRKYYNDYPIGGGWQITDIKEEGNRILVGVLIPDSNATRIASQPRERQERAISVACPNRYEEIWKLLDPNQELIIQARSQNPFSVDVNCAKFAS